jgi:hypothetical protein
MTMIRGILIVAAVFAAPPLALAQDEVMAARFGNTTVTHTDSGHEVHMYYNADHSFTGKVVDVGFPVKGTWAVDAGTVCLTYNPPPPSVTNPVCQPVAPHNLGDTWTVGKNTVTLMKGIQ